MTNDDQRDQPDLANTRELFKAALERPVADRADWLNASGASPDTIREVQRLLDAHESDAVNLQSIVGRAASEAIDQQTAALPERIGPYEIIEELGAGGMGRVFLARRADDQYRQRVAIKVLGSRLPGKQLLERFKAERQILANLNHPYIAKLLDGGETGDGLPYLVMEFVDGEPILDYCRAHSLDLKGRIELFLDVCDAIQHAHQNFVIHRDVKSGNIVVSTDGKPKLLDFGIAKIVHSDDPGVGHAHTIGDARVMTPANASPEQVQGGPITAATDVYALGLLLYELLVGLPPYETADLSPAELEKVICQTAPELPSIRVTQSRDEFLSRAQATRRLPKELAGDLDTIVLNALRKEPERRYATVKALADDIRNFLNHRPVQARPDTLFYRLAKFARRERTAVILSSVFVTVLVTVGAYSVERIIDERDRANTEAQTASAVLRFVVDTFRQANPDESEGETVTVKDALGLGSAQLSANESLPPAARATLDRTFGEVYFSLGLFDDAVSHLRRSTETFAESNDPQEQVVSMRLLGTTLSIRGDRVEARETLEQALAMSEAHFTETNPEYAATLHRLGTVMGSDSEYDAAIGHFRRSIQIFEQSAAVDHPEYLPAVYALGEALMVIGQFEESEAVLRKGMELSTAANGERNTITIDFIRAVAVTLHEAGDLKGAEPYYLRSDELEIDLLGEDHPNREFSLTSIGSLYRHMGDIEKAEHYLRAAVEAAKAGRGERHVFTAYDSINLANFLGQQGNYEESEALFLEALAIYEDNELGNHLYVASAYMGYASLLLATERYEEALELTRAANEICRIVLPPGHTLIGSSLAGIGRAYIGLGDLDAAETYLLEAYETVKTATPNDPDMPSMYRRLIRLYEARNEPERVAEYQTLLDQWESSR